MVLKVQLEYGMFEQYVKDRLAGSLVMNNLRESGMAILGYTYETL